MKPIKLIMSAFGPFADVTEIDFERFEGSGVYLVTGDTGTGKTTIFDGISFALYGESSGGKDKRSGTSYRSDFAMQSAETYVIFRFEQHGEIYEIRRSPAYERAYKKGREGTTAVPAARELKRLSDGKTYSSEEDVKKKISDIIGLDRMEFSQTVMIAQGDFQKIIRSDSDSRKQIFQRLFNTGIYEKFQIRLKEINSELEYKYNKISNGITAEMERGRTDEETFDGPDIKDPMNYEKYLLKITAYNDKCGKRLVELEELHKKNIAESEKLTSQITEASELNRKLNELEKKRSALGILKEKSGEMKEKSKKSERAEKASAVTLFWKLYEEKSVSANREYDLLESTLKERESQGRIFEKSSRNLENAKKNAASVDDLKKELTLIEKTLPKFEQLDSIKREYEKECQELIRLKSESESSAVLYRQALDCFVLGQAGILAQQLEENSPCPVCGSLSHPSPAKTEEKFPSQKKVNDLEKASKKAESVYRQCSDRCLELKTSAERLMEDELLMSSDFETQRKRLKKISLDVETKEKELEKAAETYDLDKHKKTVLEERTVMLKNKYESLKEESKKLLEDFNSALSENGFSDREDYESAKLSHNEIAGLRKELEKYRTELRTLEISVKELEELTVGKKSVNIEEMENRKKQLSEQDEIVMSESAVLKTRREINEGVIKKVNALSGELNKTREQWGKVQDIYKTVSGQKGGKTAKLRFETYVQQYYFMRVVDSANKRLRILTDDGFVLRCGSKAKNLRQQSGLDLEVLDRNTGQWRDVSTLSGGETFMASLALALGLSDTVQENSGGVRLDSMFIDEGFGTLDENSLRKAIELIDKLADGKRLIGIISHVGELKNRIDRKIVVSKTPAGSRAEIVGC